MAALKPDRSTPPRTFRISDLRLPEVYVGKFENSMECHVIRTTSEPVCRIDWVFKTGREGADNPMIPVFTAAMLKEGCKGKSSQQIADELDSLGADLSCRVGINYSSISLVCLRRHAAPLMELIRKLLLYPTFPSDKLEILTGSARYAFETRQKKVDYVASQLLREAIYGPGHPYSRHREASDYKLSTADLKSFHAKHYRSANCYMVLSGNADRGLYDLAEDYFGGEPWNQGSIMRRLIPRLLPSQNYKVKASFGDSLQTCIAMGAPTACVNDPDYYGVCTLVTSLGGYFGSRLNRSVREEKGYTYGISARLTSYPDKASFSIHTSTSNEVVAEAIDAIKAELALLADEEMPSSELSTVRNVMVGQMKRSFENPLYVSEDYIILVSRGKDFEHYRNFYDYLNGADPAALRSLAEKYLSGELYEAVAGR